MRKISINLKLLFLFSLVFFLKVIAIGQIPESFKYQAVVRNSSGEIISNSTISVRISIVKGNEIGDIVYRETHSTTTNQFGLINLNIGQGNSSDDFSAIDWGNDYYFTQIELDLEGGANYSLLGTSQLRSVPYALYAKNVENINDSDADSTNEIQLISISNDTIYLENGGFVKLPDDKYIDSDADSTNEIQLLSISNDTIYLENGGYVKLPEDKVNDADADITNEIQTLENVLVQGNDAGKKQIKNLAAPSDSLDAVTKSYVDILIQRIETLELELYGEIWLSDSTGKFKDNRDDNIYNFIKIGSQIWMSENLVFESDTGSWFYEDKSTDSLGLGRYYIYETSLNVCPDGWHLPSDSEWMILEINLGMSLSDANSWDLTRGDNEGEKLKTGGFKAILAGTRGSNGTFSSFDYQGSFGSSTSYNSGLLISRSVQSTNNKIWRGTNDKETARSIRCVKD